MAHRFFQEITLAYAIIIITIDTFTFAHQTYYSSKAETIKPPETVMKPTPPPRVLVE